MSLHFVTGTAGEDHITGDDWGHLNAGIVGSGSYVLKTGNRLKATVASANSITISDGDAVMMGRHVRLSSPESVAIESGTIGQKRNDIIAIRYAKTSNGDLQKEAATLVAVKGTPSTGTPDDPETDSSDILSGATTAEMPLYRIPIDGVTVGTPVPLFDVLTPAAEVWDSVSRMPEIYAGTSVVTVNGNHIDVSPKRTLGLAFEAKATDVLYLCNGDQAAKTFEFGNPRYLGGDFGAWIVTLHDVNSGAALSLPSSSIRLNWIYVRS